MFVKPSDNHQRSVEHHREDRPSIATSDIKSQIRLVIILTLAVFFCKGIIMVILNLGPPLPPWLEVLFDSTALIVLLSPVLYYLLFHSRARHIQDRRQASVELEKHRNNLEELVAERNTAIIAANKKLRQEISEHRKTEKTLRERSLDLDSRIRKLQCLYAISTLLEKSDTSLDEIIQKTVELIRFAWLQPDKICARVSLDQQAFESENFKKTGLVHESAFLVMGKPAGTLAVYRFEEKPANDAKSFSTGEIKLIGAVADQMGKVVQQKRTEMELYLAREKSKTRDKQITALLEEKVKARTKELEIANVLLKDQIKEREKAENKLAQSKVMLQSVFDGISDRLILVDKDMRIKMMNRSAAEHYGNKALEDFIGKPCYEGTGKKSRCEDCEIPIAVKQGRQITFERKGFMEPDRMEKVVIYPLKDNGNSAGDAIIRIADITEKRIIENQLIQSEKLASLGVLVSSVAHEINNPNSFVTLNLPILRDYLNELLPIVDDFARKKPDFELFNMGYPEFRKDISKLLDNIEHGSDRINNFVANLREFTQGRENKPLERIDVNQIIENVVSICRAKIKEVFKSFIRTIPEDLPQIYTDPYAVEQVLINLVVNAAQAADKKDSWLKISASNGGTWEQHLLIEVSDNGEGMDEITMHNIFDPFFTTKSPVEGTGLGLYVCHNLIQGLGGRIEVDSEISRGSTFRVILPDKERRSAHRGQDRSLSS